MSDLTLSQDEIDALLMGSSSAKATKKSLSASDETALKALMKEVLPGLSAALGGLVTGRKVSVNPPSLELVDRDGLLDNLDQEVVELRADFTGKMAADHAFFLNPEEAQNLAGDIMGQVGVELNTTAINALEEMASMFSGSLVTTLSRKSPAEVSPGPVQGQKIVKAMTQTSADNLVAVTWTASVDSETFKIVETFDYNFLKPFLSSPKDATKQEATSEMGFANPSAGAQMPGMAQFAVPQGGMQPMQGMGPAGMQGMPGQMMPGQGMPGMVPPGAVYPPGYGMPMGYPPGMYPSVQGVQYPSLTPGAGHAEQGNIGLLMDVTMEVTVELGRAKQQIKQILSMGEGTIIALDKLAGEPVDILVNHKLIAKGEVVVIDENFGVRVTEIVSNPDRAMEA